MSEYLSWGKTTLADFTDETINRSYNNGYVFTRINKGIMNRTRSLRINLSKFELSSENRRVLKKMTELERAEQLLPIPEEKYSWRIHKLAKDFYVNKFGDKTFSAAKIKELVTDASKSNFNVLLKFSEKGMIVGYVICYQNSEIMHYAYPFYDLVQYASNYGMGMLLSAINYAKESGKKYFYIGSVTRPADKYKLQFAGLEWFDRNTWQTDLTELKNVISAMELTKN